jgi:hypothetical protein
MPGRKQPQTCLRAFCVTPQYAGSAELEPGWLASETARPLWGRIAAPLLPDSATTNTGAGIK